MIINFYIYPLILLISFSELGRTSYFEEFLNENFERFFTNKIKIFKTPRINEYKLICSEKIEKNELIFKIPLDMTIKLSDKFIYDKEIVKTIKSFHIDNNAIDTVTMLIHLLFEHYITKNNEKTFINSYLNSVINDRDTILWWDKNDVLFFKKSVYNYNEEWIHNMIKETDNIINLTLEILKKFQEINKIELPSIILEENEIRNNLELLHKSSIFLEVSNEWEKWISITEEKKSQPIIIPLFDMLKRGKTKSSFDVPTKCSININSKNVNNFLRFESDFIEHYSDCEFEKGDEYFILTRTGSSFENFLTYGYINEFETYDLMEIIITDQITLPQREFLLSIKVIDRELEHPLFYLDTKRINYKIRDFYIVKCLTKFKIKLNLEIFKKKLFNIDDVNIYLDAYLGYKNVLLKKMETHNSTLEQDIKNYENFKFKKRNKEEKLKKNVLLLKMMQRKILDQQLKLVNEKILKFLHLKEKYLEKIILKNVNKQQI